MSATDYAIGLDLGGTRLKAVAVTPTGVIRHTLMVPNEPSDAEVLVALVRGTVAQLEATGGGPARWLGIAAPGIAAADARTVYWMMGRMAHLQGLDWTARLGRPVPVINDAQAALLAEVWLGAAKGARNVLLLTLGTGVGGAILCDGHLLRGALGRAGHLGHVTVDPDGPRDIVNTPGSLEYAIGNYSIAERSQGRFQSTQEMLTALAAGDAWAQEVWLRSVKALAAALAGLINAVDPELVILGGGIAQAGDALFTPLARFLDQFEWRPHDQRVRLLPAVGGEFSGALGAAWEGMRKEKM